MNPILRLLNAARDYRTLKPAAGSMPADARGKPIETEFLDAVDALRELFTVTSVQYRVRWDSWEQVGGSTYSTLESARKAIDFMIRNWGPDAATIQMEQQFVVRWPDGTTLTGPWEPVPGESPSD